MTEPTEPLRVLIVDDEPLARAKLRDYLRQLAGAFEVQEAKNGFVALAAIPELKPDVVLLDMEMPGLGGLELLAQLPRRDFAVIFQTAFDEYAIQAFEENACDYLLKPFTLERFAKAMAKAVTQRGRASTGVAAAELRLLAHQGYMRRIVIRQSGQQFPVPTTAIDCLVSKDHYTLIYGAEARELVSELSLDHLEGRLDPRQFCRIHRAAIVRLESVASVSAGETPVATMKNGMELSVARRRRGDLMALLKSL